MKLKTPFYRLLLVSIWAILGLTSRAQTPTYEYHVTNEQQISSKIYQFDVYLLRTGSTELQLASIQFGIGYDVSVLNGGTPTFSYVSGSTQLQGSQATFTINTGAQTSTINSITYRFMNQAVASLPGAGNGTIISNTRSGCTTVGTRIGTYRLTNTVDFAAGSTMKHIFSTSAAAGRTNTLVAAYIGTTNTQIGVASSNLGYQASGTCIQNIALNCALVSAPTKTNVLCNGGSTGSASANVTGNTAAVSYTISGTPAVTNTTGATTGVFTGLPAGTYVISYTSGACSGSTSAIVITQPAILKINSENTTIACPGGSSTVTLSGEGGTPGYTFSNGTTTNTTGIFTQSAGTVNYTITDANGCTASGNTTVAAGVDNTAPVIGTCASNQSVSAGGTGSALVPDFTAGVIATDNCSSVTITQSPAAGSSVGVGSQTITITATDASNNTSTCTATLTVTSGCALSSSPSFTNVSCAGGSNGTASANVSGNTQAVSYTIAGPTVNNTGASSGTFTGLSAGTYVISYTSGACSGSTSNIVVGTTADVTAPVISTCASNQSVSAGGTGSATIPDFTGGVSATDNCSSVTITQSPTAGGTRVPGSYTITLTATDASGNTSTCTATLTVTSGCALSSSPSFTNVGCAGGSNGTASANVSGNTQAVSYTIAGPTVNNTGASSGTFTGLSAGTYVISYTSGACSGSTSDIVVGTTADVTAPVISTCASNQSVTSGTGNVPNMTGGVIATDNCSSVTVTQSPAAGTTLPVGSHTITFTATDASGNTATCTATLTVVSGCNYTIGDSIVGRRNACPFMGPVGGTATYSIATTSASGFTWTVSNPTTMQIVGGQGTGSLSVKFTSTFVSGTISVTVTSACGGPTTRTTNLITKSLPSAPASISGPLNICPFLGNDVPVTYSIPPVANGNAVSYRWTIPENVVLLSASSDSTSITVKFLSGFVSNASKALKVKTISGCGNSADKSVTLVNVAPLFPGVISGEINACPYIDYDSVAYYRLKKVANTTNYIWTVPAGVTIVARPGGEGTANDTIIGVKFTNAFVGGTFISVQASSPCGTTSPKNFTINRSSSAVPGVIAGPVNSCPLKVGSDNASGTPTEYRIRRVKFATSYTWTVPSNAVILSPVASATTTIINDTTINTRDTAITVRFLSNYAGGNISVQSVTGCGSSAKKNLIVKDALLATPGTIAGPLNPCPLIGGPDTTTYRIKKVALATSYNWSAGAGGEIISHPGGTGVNDTIVVIRWSASSTYGPVTVTAQNNCRTSSVKSLVIMPLRPGIPGTITGITNPCNNIGSQVTYSVAALPANATSLLWTAPAGASIVGSATGLSVQVVYQSSFTTGAISVVGVNNCSNSAPKTLNIVRVAPATPGAITATVTSTVCATRAVTYSLASLPLNATSVNWTAPAGGTITVLSATSISVAYPSTAVTGAVTATGVNGCGQTSAAKSLAVSLPACTVIGRTTAPAISKATSPIKAVIEPASMEAKVFPNPSTTSFKLQVLTSGKEKIQIRVMDIMGRAYKVLYMMPGEILNFGSELRTGTYMVEIIQGKNRTTQQVIKL